MKRPRRLRLKIALALLLLAVAAFPYGWGPAIAGCVARSYLDLEEPGSSELRVECVTPFRLRASGLRVGALPGAPSCERVEVRYSPGSLLSGRIRSARLSGLSVDAASLLPHGEDGAGPFADDAVQASFTLDWNDGYRGTLSGTALGGPLGGVVRIAPDLRSGEASLEWSPVTRAFDLPTLRARAAFESSPTTNGADAAFRAGAELAGTPWRVEARGGVTNGALNAVAELPRTLFSDEDPLLGPLLAKSVPETLGLRFSGAVSGVVEVARAPKDALPSWKSLVRISDLGIEAQAGGTPLRLEGGGAYLPASGLGAHCDLRPMGVRFARFAWDPIELDRGSVWFRADGDSLLLTEASAGFCGGHVRLYALHLNFESLNAGFTLFLDDLETGRVLALLPGFDGTATGTLHGKLPLSLRRGQELRLRNAFLYSPPGQVGIIRLADATPLVDRLRVAGLPEQTYRDLDAALRNLEYDVLRLDYATGDGFETLGIRLHGAAADNARKTPVDLRIDVEGDLQESVNIALRAAGLLGPGPGAARGAGSRSRR